LRQVFGLSSPYNIRYILAEHPKKSGSRARPFDTVLPLSQDLYLTINSSIARDDVQSAADAAKAYQGEGNVLVCWEHGQLAKIAKALGKFSHTILIILLMNWYSVAVLIFWVGCTGYGPGVSAAERSAGTGEDGSIVYPGDRFDLIWTVRWPYTEIESVTSERTEADKGLVDPSG
jgi:hypothetical protein